VMRVVKGRNTIVRSFADKISKAANFPPFYAFAPFWCVSTFSRAATVICISVQKMSFFTLLLT
ncbi:MULTISPECIES: hypothetical protein, partial [Citrobacter freundii complex]|uniref:hypothetical protein n=1 Tax=Citrobacter freundii complex TaxID=1344959 RepID=UPI0034D55F00